MDWILQHALWIAVTLLLTFYGSFFLWFKWEVDHAPMGHEDKSGFHFDK